MRQETTDRVRLLLDDDEIAKLQPEDKYPAALALAALAIAEELRTIRLVLEREHR
jgi:hypothetical protein